MHVAICPLIVIPPSLQEFPVLASGPCTCQLVTCRWEEPCSVRSNMASSCQLKDIDFKVSIHSCKFVKYVFVYIQV